MLVLQHFIVVMMTRGRRDTKGSQTAKKFLCRSYMASAWLGAGSAKLMNLGIFYGIRPGETSLRSLPRAMFYEGSKESRSDRVSLKKPALHSECGQPPQAQVFEHLVSCRFRKLRKF